MSALASRRCLPCEGGVPALVPDEVERLRAELPEWEVAEGRELRRSFRFPDFVGLMAFVNRLADLAEAERHHPDFTVHFSVLDVRIWTHAIGGLSENDFILAAKLDLLPR